MKRSSLLALTLLLDLFLGGIEATARMLDWVGRGATSVDLQNSQSSAMKVVGWLLALPGWATGTAIILLTLFLCWELYQVSPKTANENKTSAEKSASPVSVVTGVEPAQPKPQEINSLETYFSKKIIRFADLITGDEFILEGKTFEDCYLYGPAVLAFEGNGELSYSRFDGDLDSILIRLCLAIRSPCLSKKSISII